MKLWLLKPAKTISSQSNPWEPWFDKAFGFVVRAESEADARSLAADRCGDETYSVWLSPLYTTCEFLGWVLTESGEAEVILRDYCSA